MEITRDYAAIPHEYLDEMDVLSDAEFGRLVRFILAYSMKGTPIALSGNERFFAKRVTAREDRFQKSFLESQEKRSSAGQAGANARWANAKDAIACDRMAPHPTACEEMRSDADDGYTKPKPKPDTKPEENTTSRSARGSARGRTEQDAVQETFPEGHEALKAAILRWLQYKRQRRQSYAESSLQTLLSQIRKHAEEYGDEAIIGLIDTSMTNNWQGIFFDRLQKAGPKMPGSHANYGPVDTEKLKSVAQKMGAEV